MFKNETMRCGRGGGKVEKEENKRQKTIVENHTPRLELHNPQ